MKIIESMPIKSVNIAIIVSQFNQEITDALLNGAVTYLQEKLIHDYTVVRVPGAVEIPLIAQKLAQSRKFDAILALGAVIRGETSHYDYVCEQVSQGCQKVMLDHQLPIIFGILTTENEAQCWDRLGGKHGHKGREAAMAALDMVSIIRQIE